MTKKKETLRNELIRSNIKLHHRARVYFAADDALDPVSYNDVANMIDWCKTTFGKANFVGVMAFNNVSFRFMTEDQLIMFKLKYGSVTTIWK